MLYKGELDLNKAIKIKSKTEKKMNNLKFHITCKLEN